MSNVSNKKRNSLLLHELLVRKLSKSLMVNDMGSANLAYKLLRRYFKPGTELHREWRLATSLHRTTVSSENVALSIISEARSACKSLDESKIDKEKSHLIKAINHGFKDKEFYNQKVPDYRTRMTVGSLMSWWKTGNVDIGQRAVFEEQLMRWLLQPKDDLTVDDASLNSPGSSIAENKLILNLAAKKMNENYGEKFTTEQLSMLRKFSLNDPTLKDDLESVRERLASAAKVYESNHPDDTVVVTKLQEAVTRAHGDTLTSIDETTVNRYLQYAEVIRELVKGNEVNDEG